MAPLDRQYLLGSCAVLIAITSDGKIGLGLRRTRLHRVRLVSSFVLPRRYPNFPGERLGLFILVTVILFAGTIFGVLHFAAEEEEHGSEAVATGTETGEEPATSEPASTEPATTGAAEEPAGDAAAGEEVFASAGCAACHTLEAAGSSGQVGPNLDDAEATTRPGHRARHERDGADASFKGQLSDKQIEDVAAFVVESTSG